MQISIIIPVWNGASVVLDCLEAVYHHSGPDLSEVICVDNDSSDESSTRIAETYPQVRLIREPANLGFAGGVNAGMEIARGDIFILLNQDCIVQAGWLDALLEAFRVYPQYGIAGCTIYNADGTVNHSGATIHHPDAMGSHITDLGDCQVKSVEFVTGAAFAIRRQTWETVGRFDEGYYPAYYEDSDYCYRARRKGFETAWVPDAHVRHLFSNRSWQTNPINHITNGCTSRYRFVCKHFSGQEFGAFHESEVQSLETSRYLDFALAEMIAAHRTLRNLPEILARRQLDMDDALSKIDQMQLQAGFTKIFQQGLEKARKLTISEIAIPAPGEDFRSAATATFDKWVISAQRLEDFRQREVMLANRLYHPYQEVNRPDGVKHRSFQPHIERIKHWLSGCRHALSFLVGGNYHEHILFTELISISLDHMTALEQRIELATEIDEHRRAEERLRLLELLTEFEYR